jgi:hypothetical protein
VLAFGTLDVVLVAAEPRIALVVGDATEVTSLPLRVVTSSHILAAAGRTSRAERMERLAKQDTWTAIKC